MFDNLQYITDVTLIDRLNNLLLQSIKSKIDDKLHLSPPEIVDWDNIDGFSFTEKGEVFKDLITTDLFDYLSKRNITLSIKNLKKRRVYARVSNQQTSFSKWSIYNCLVHEVKYEDEIYVLTVGLWFKINRSFIKTVQEYLSSISDSSINMPDCLVNETEGDYNLRVGLEKPSVLTLDAKNVVYGGTSIEICDLLTKDKKLVHVKKWNSSSTLSHLFAQGRISAESLMQDSDFRRISRKKISEFDSDFVDVIPKDNFIPMEYEIIFAIIYPQDVPVNQRLPFFSKLNMMQSVKHLKSLGFNVTTKRIKQNTIELIQ